MSPSAKRRAEPYTPYILVVDDDPQVRKLFCRILENSGYLVAEAGNGRAALAACRERFFDVVVCDLSMPDMDGFELLKALRVELPSIRILIVSGFLHSSLLPMAHYLGAAQTLAKTEAPERLLMAICELLQVGAKF